METSRVVLIRYMSLDGTPCVGSGLLVDGCTVVVGLGAAASIGPRMTSMPSRGSFRRRRQPVHIEETAKVCPRAGTSTECCRIAPSCSARVDFLRITMAPKQPHPDTYQRRRPRRGPRAATGAFLRSEAWVPGGSVLQEAGPRFPRSSHPHLPGRRDER